MITLPKKLPFAVLLLSFALGLASVASAAVEKTATMGSRIPATGPVSLRDTVAMTIEYSPNIKSFQEYRQAAEYDLKRARSGWFPRIDARAGYGADQWSSAATRASSTPLQKRQDHRTFYDRSEASLVISQTIWDGMATANRVNIGESRLESAKNRLFDNAEAYGLDAALAHIEIYRQRRIVALAELNVKNHQSILASQRERQSSGAATMADVTQTQSRLARTQASLTESRSALEVAISTYKRLTGKDVGEVQAPESPADMYPSLDVALAHSHTGNLKLKTARADLATAEHQTELDKSPFHPQIFLEAGPSYRYRVEDAMDDAGGTSIMLRATWNIFNGGYDWYNVKGDKARARQSRQDMFALMDSLADETAATWSQLISAQEQARYYANSVEYSTKTRDMYLEQFNVGQRSLLDVLDAENELFSSSIQYVTTQQNVIAGQYRLLALGGDFLSAFGLDFRPLAKDMDDWQRAGYFYNEKEDQRYKPS